MSEQVKSLPVLDEAALTEADRFAADLPPFSPFDPTSLSVRREIRYRGNTIPFTFAQEGKRTPTYILSVGDTTIITAFHHNEDMGIPLIANQKAVNKFWWAEIELIRSKTKGQGFGMLSVQIMDRIFSRIAEENHTPLFVFADDDSNPRLWTTAALGKVAYTTTSRGCLLKILSPRKGPRSYKWYWNSGMGSLID